MSMAMSRSLRVGTVLVAVQTVPRGHPRQRSALSSTTADVHRPRAKPWGRPVPCYGVGSAAPLTAVGSLRHQLAARLAPTPVPIRPAGHHTIARGQGATRHEVSGTQ